MRHVPSSNNSVTERPVCLPVLFAWSSWDSVVLIFFVLNLAKVQKEAYEKKEKEKAKQARTHVSCL